MTAGHTYPATKRLTRALAEVLWVERKGRSVLILERSPNVYASTFPSEVLRCKVDKQHLTILAKYEVETGEPELNHRRSLIHEARVFENILQGCPLTTPRYFGRYEGANGRVWLFFEFVEDSLRLDRGPYPGAVGTAARWLGEFHRWSSQVLQATRLEWLPKYDAGFYAAWPDLAERLDEGHRRWLPTVCKRASQATLELLVEEPVVIHGEFYPHNVLWREGAVFPVDWQSAAIAAGEIDLAALTERWKEEPTGVMLEAYQKARWPDGIPPGFQRRLFVASVYWSFRWLVGSRRSADSSKSRLRYRLLKRQSEEAGWI